MEKIFLTANDLLDDAFRLADKIAKSGFHPTFIVGIWRGGAPFGIAVQEYFDVCNIETDHSAVRTSSYTGIDERSSRVGVYGMQYIVERVGPDDRLLIVDDVFDTGRSIEALLQELTKLCGANTPQTIKTATVYYKPKKRLAAVQPDFTLYETEDWLVFPHEIKGLSQDEIKNGKSQVIADILADR